MIRKECYTREWIQKISSELRYPDVNLIEKVIRAFSLVELLSSSGCPFTWKGGSALMLLLSDTRHRLSIDIDVICPPGTDIEKYLKDFRQFGCLDVETVERIQRNTNIPKTHSKFFYKIAFRDNEARPGNILLDVLYEDCHYNKIERVPVRSPFFELDGEPLTVNIPSVNDILGDKLTAFAPNTSGIPYFKGPNDCNLEIAKQLYDIGRLFDRMDDLSVVASAYDKIARVELSYRRMEENPLLSLKDTFETALCLSTRGAAGLGVFTALQNGISRLSSFMYMGKYQIEEAVADAAKAAYLATLIRKGATSFSRYDGGSVLPLRLTPAVPVKLGKLRIPAPEAYFYWVNTSELLNE
ncbi:MAG: nucleotidyl transferase AbiEii/AbiGii toxin family protein [Bacteroidales bacterium]|nr:nucleotidyl transferase AbiEii/AbiGii toxin family protein [Bacteroidales bacterium]